MALLEKLSLGANERVGPIQIRQVRGVYMKQIRLLAATRGWTMEKVWDEALARGLPGLVAEVKEERRRRA